MTRKTQFWAIMTLLLVSVFCTGAYAQKRTDKKPFQVTWLGHAAFEIISPGGTRILIDPWLKQNPQTPAIFKDLSRYHPAAILVSHSHFDHSQDALEIAQASGAPVVSSGDWVEKLGLPEKQQLGCDIGGTIPTGVMDQAH
jgi:L-ascorbate metabolism protein UlaG (beta-lactamase superfamily)